MSTTTTDSPTLRHFEAFCEAVDRELAAMEAQHRPAFDRCASVTDREARDWLRAKAAALGFEALSREIVHLGREELAKAGRMLARHLFQASPAASYDCPALTCWALLDSAQIAEILRCLWVPKLIDRPFDHMAAALSAAARPTANAATP